MIVESVAVRDIGSCFQGGFHAQFGEEQQCVIGACGGGKTTLLNLIAGVAGSDEATALVAGRPVGSFKLVLREGDELYEFIARDRFKSSDIADFKATLPKRVSYLTDGHGIDFPTSQVDVATGIRRFKNFLKFHNGGSVERSVFYSPNHRRVWADFGGGYNHVLSVLLNDSTPGTPILIDDPVRHLDLWAQRLLIDMMVNEDRQFIFTTHSPEAFWTDSADVIDVSRRGKKNKKNIDKNSKDT
jgi:ABC-type cobalamin/Fe3+-siderophores transport system ATPase subunit